MLVYARLGRFVGIRMLQLDLQPFAQRPDFDARAYNARIYHVIAELQRGDKQYADDLS
jgi:hypothetical protein